MTNGCIIIKYIAEQIKRDENGISEIQISWKRTIQKNGDFFKEDSWDNLETSNFMLIVRQIICMIQ